MDPTDDSETQTDTVTLDTTSDGSADNSAALGDKQAGDSPTPEGEKKPETSLLDAVSKALKDEGPAEDPPASTGEKDKKVDAKSDAAGDSAAADKEPADPTEAELSRYKPETAARMRTLLSQRNVARGEADKLKPLADVARQLQTYMGANSLTLDEVNDALEIQAALKSDPEAAYKALLPYMDRLLNLTGRRLTPELRDKVKRGEISESDAINLSMSNARASLAEGATKRTTEGVRRSEQTAANTRMVTEIVGAANVWEQQWKSIDPDYPHKVARVRDRIAVRISAKPPKSKDEAVKLAKDCLAEVNAEMAAILPPRRSVAPPVKGGGRNPQSKPEPKTTLEAIHLALQ